MIRRIRADDRERYLRMARDFYHSDAVDHSLPESYYEDTFAELMRSDAYASAYILEYEGRPAGYALLARTFSQEAGGPVIWLEELYVEPSCRGCGLGREFLDFLCGGGAGPYRRLRLEAEDDNRRAISLYRRMGFTRLPYRQMIRDAEFPPESRQ